ncbi:putative signal transducing protein [Kaistella sp.]|uniref:putative signal transducing protein n=1 Tax=Kaistella sp. TaxID=2782235 RepID=UPI003C5BFA3F
MERETRVAVFESEKPSEIQLVKSKLDMQNIASFLNDNYMSFTTTPTANTVKLMVNLQDEQKAFEIIDRMLKETDFNHNNN